MKSLRNLITLASVVLLMFAAYATAVTVLLSSATGTGAGAAFDNPSADKTFQAYGATSGGTGTAAITIQGTNVASCCWETVGTMTLTLGTATTSSALTSTDRYAFSRANVTSISGTGATVSVTRSY